MTRDALTRGFEVLILTNAMQPMQRPKIKQALLSLHEEFGERLRLRVSLDHYTKKLHETERGKQTWDKALEGLDWLAENGISFDIAGRTCWHEEEDVERLGYADLIKNHGWPVDPIGSHSVDAVS